MVVALLTLPVWWEWLIAVVAQKGRYGCKLTDAGWTEDGAALLTATTLWREDEI